MSERRTGRIAARVIAVLLAAAAFRSLVWAPLYANRALKLIELRTRAADIASDRRIFLARDNLDALARVEPSAIVAVDYHMLYAANDRIIGLPQDAIEHYTAALGIEHRPEIYFERGMTWLEARNVDAAVRDLTVAVRFDPVYMESLDLQTRSLITAAQQR
jgi:tetratricopeptide (TPR) repeat protein